MYVEDLDTAIELRKRRREVQALLDGARSGSVGDFSIWYQGDRADVWKTIDKQLIRETIATECERLLALNSERLHAIGVNTAPKLILRRSDNGQPESL